MNLVRRLQASFQHFNFHCVWFGNCDCGQTWRDLPQTTSDTIGNVGTPTGHVRRTPALWGASYNLEYLPLADVRSGQVEAVLYQNLPDGTPCEELPGVPKFGRMESLVRIGRGTKIWPDGTPCERLPGVLNFGWVDSPVRSCRVTKCWPDRTPCEELRGCPNLAGWNPM